MARQIAYNVGALRHPPHGPIRGPRGQPDPGTGPPSCGGRGPPALRPPLAPGARAAPPRRAAHSSPVPPPPSYRARAQPPATPPTREPSLAAAAAEVASEARVSDVRRAEEWRGRGTSDASSVTSVDCTTCNSRITLGTPDAITPAPTSREHCSAHRSCSRCGRGSVWRVGGAAVRSRGRARGGLRAPRTRSRPHCPVESARSGEEAPDVGALTAPSPL